MHKSTRLVSVAFSYVALIVGLFALPSVGHGDGVTYPVLNWIPPTSLAGGSPCEFFTFPAPATTTPPTPPTTCPTTSTAGAKEVTGIIPMWLSSDTSNSVVYNFAMVGKDPSVKGSAGTTIDTKIVPLRFTSASPALTFDPENNDSCSPKRTPALNMVQQSPVFKAGNTPYLKTIGTAQFVSLFQRANFWTYTQPTAASPSYEVTLSQVLTNSEENVKHTISIIGAIPAPPDTNPANLTTPPYSINGVVQTDSTWCDPLAIIDVNELDTLLQTQIIPALKGPGVTPTTLPIFLLSNVAMSYTVLFTSPVDASLNTSTTYCCILGYHNAYPSASTGATAGKLQTYIVANYDTTSGTANGKTYSGAFPAAPDLVALANMIAGWMDNPTTLNTTPAWSGTINGSTGNQNTLEVAYPPAVGGGLATFTMPNKTVYHVQNLAFKSWFYCDQGSANSGFGGSYSLSLAVAPLSTPNPLCP
jgi:hypothetical protein